MRTDATDDASSARPRRGVGDKAAGVALMLGAVALFAGIDASAKVGGTYVPKLELVWFRFAVQTTIVAIVLNPWQSPGSWRTRRPLLQIARACIQVVCTGLNFVALGYLQVAEVLSIQFLTPLFVAILSVLLLDERLDRKRWSAIAAGFVGVLVVTRPGFSGASWAFAVSLTSVAIGANYNLITRELARTETPGSMLLLMAAVPTVLIAPALPSVWVWPQEWAASAALLGVGAFGTAGHYLMILAHRRLPASALAPLQYFQLPVTVGLGYVLFSDVPTAWTFLGTLIVVGSGICVMLLPPASDGRATSGPASKHPPSARGTRQPHQTG